MYGRGLRVHFNPSGDYRTEGARSGYSVPTPWLSGSLSPVALIPAAGNHFAGINPPALLAGMMLQPDRYQVGSGTAATVTTLFGQEASLRGVRHHIDAMSRAKDAPHEGS